MKNNDMANGFVLKENDSIGEKYYYKIHPTGLPIYVIPKKFTTYYAIFATKYGSVDRIFKTKDEKDFITVPDGIAHYLEHKMFENEDGEDTFLRYARYGGNANAFTSFDKTAYLFSCTENFDENLEILLDFVSKPYFTPETVQKEQGIIGQEIKMYDDNPGWRVYFNLLGALYKDHPVKVDIAGTVESIAQITAETLYRCYNTFYNLNNMVLCVCGDVTPEQVEAVADKVLGTSPAPDPKIERTYPTEELKINKPVVKQKMDVAKPLYYIGIKMKPSDEGTSPLHTLIEHDVLQRLLFGPDSDFYAENYESGLINPQFNTEYEEARDYAHLVISGTHDDPMKVFEKIKEEIDKRKKEFFSKEDFEREKKTAYASSLFMFDHSSDIANIFMNSYMNGTDIYEGFDYFAELTYEDIKKRFIDTYDTSLMAISIIEPKQEA